MQAVILAAGNSTRTYPLTITKPKPLLKIANKTILEHNLLNLIGRFDEIIIVVGYKKDLITKFIGKNYPSANIKFVEQKKPLGTGNAISILEDHIKDRFILLMGDNIYSKNDIDRISENKYALLVKNVDNPEFFGVIKEQGGIVIDVIEKPKKFISNLVSCALYSLDKDIFPFLKMVKKSERGEYEITDAIKSMSGKKRIKCIESESCIQISFPWDLLEADKILRGNANNIDIGSIVSGTVVNSSIGENCKVEGNVRDSIIMDNVVVDEGSTIQSSILGDYCSFSGITLSSENSKSFVNGIKFDAGNMGAILGDRVTAKNVIINPGCKIWPNKKIEGKIKNDIQ
jgi:UDP-N-acetylglucosamine diphosphorylase / glucose-1-phosphate thymidylyltransferase / UDP-N-acetylgalactosamine diphosphorylase / glucosamine-1-phosphate N-acetyltransferase / galactosamine-1-phosphate N-acetyltransferase